MDRHVFYHETTKLKMTAKMIMNKIMGSRKRLVISLMLAVLFLDVCMIAAPRTSPAAARGAPTPEVAAPALRHQQSADPDPDPADPDLDPTDQQRAQSRRQRSRPAGWSEMEEQQELRRELELDGDQPAPIQTQERSLKAAKTGWGPDVRQLDDRDTWDSINEVDVDGDGISALKLEPAAAPAAPVVRVQLEVESGEENVNVKLNGQSLMVPETNNRTRGLHVLVLEQNTYAVLARRRFDTVLAEVYREVVRFLDAVRPGRIIVLATKDDISYNMHSDLRFKLTQLGSQFIPDLSFRDQWAMVTVKGSGETLGETFSPAPVKDEFGGPLFLRVDLTPGSLPATPPCRWPDSEESRRRHAFCDNYEGYTGLCRCLQPHPIIPEPSGLEENIDSIYVAVMATHRPYYLYRALRSLAFARGAQPDNIVVYLENNLNPETEALVSLFGFKVRYVASKPSPKIHLVIGNRVMDIIDDVFTHFMEAEYVLFIEEDLECSPDIFRYFGRTHTLLLEDPSLFSVSALNQQAYTNTSHATGVAYRVDSLPAAGFLLHRHTFERDIKPVWPEHAWKREWDLFLDRVARKEREVVVPDVNRVYHIGRDSHFMNTDMYDYTYKNLSVNPDPTAALEDVTRLQKLNYEDDLKATLQEGTVIRDYSDICNAENMTVLFKGQNKSEILYFHMEKENDKSTWSYIAKCWGLWPFTTTGHHGGLWRFWLENKKGLLFHMIFIGVPFSRYSSYKPSDVEPFRAPYSAAAVSSAPAHIPDNAANSLPAGTAAAIPVGGSAGTPFNSAAGIPAEHANSIPSGPAVGLPANRPVGFPANPSEASSSNSVMANAADPDAGSPARSVAGDFDDPAVVLPANAAAAISSHSAPARPSQLAIAMPSNPAVAVPFPSAAAGMSAGRAAGVAPSPTGSSSRQPAAAAPGAPPPLPTRPSVTPLVRRASSRQSSRLRSAPPAVRQGGAAPSRPTPSRRSVVQPAATRRRAGQPSRRRSTRRRVEV